MPTRFNWLLNSFPSKGRSALFLHIGIFALVIFPVALLVFLGHIRLVMLLAIAVAILTAYVLSSLVVALNLYRQKEEIFLANAGDALVVINREWKIELWNKTAEVLTGWSAEEVLDKSLRDVVKFIRERDQTENIEFIEEAMLYGRVGTMEDHVVLIRKDGLQMPVGDSAAPLFDLQGSVVGAIIVFRDKSKEHDLEEAREAFMMLATHELHAPLAAIKDSVAHMLEALTLTPGDVKAREYSEVIHDANERVYTLINQMLNVLNIEQGKLAILSEPVHLPELFDEVLKDYAQPMQAKNLTLVRAYEENIPTINLDAQLARMILQNFISNAVKCTPERGTITLQIKKDKGGLVFSVSDTGFGIPKEEQTKIFSKLFRTNNVKNRGLEGVGLGLYMVKLCVEEAGGKIWFESEENKKTTFYVFIPDEGMKKREGAVRLS